MIVFEGGLEKRHSWDGRRGIETIPPCPDDGTWIMLLSDPP